MGNNGCMLQGPLNGRIRSMMIYQLGMAARQGNVIFLGTSIIQILTGQKELLNPQKHVSSFSILQDNFMCQLGDSPTRECITRSPDYK